MRMVLRIFGLLALCFGFAPGALAHALQPGYLQVSSLSAQQVKAVWRVPDVSGRPMAVSARLPSQCTSRDAPPPDFDGQAWIVTWVADCPDGLTGGEISVFGLEQQQTDVLIRFPGPDGSVRSARLTPDRTSFVIPSDPGAFDVLITYVPLGFDHILEGFDHLLFVLALLLLIPDMRRLVGAITAFTVAHSITMAASTLGWMTLPGAPVETVIALSIIFLAAELAKRDGTGNRLSETYPWLVAFAFGLLHGFGFAGALREIGVPETDVPLALMSFNLGVELGQLLFIATALAVHAILIRLLPKGGRMILTGATASLAVAYGIGSVASFWFIERLSGFVV